LEFLRLPGTIRRGGNQRVLKVIPRDASETLSSGSRNGYGLLGDPQAPGVNSRHRLVAAAVVFGALAAAALQVDLPIAQFVKDHGLPGDLKRLVRLAEVFGWGGTVALIIATAAALDPRGWRVIPRLATATYGAGLVACGLKLLVARLRPRVAELSGTVSDTFVAWLPLAHRDSLGREYGYGLQSFPSGHAATAVGLAVALATLYPRGRWLFATFALLAGLQRIDAEAHFCSDVLAGAAIGCLVAAAWRLEKPLADRQRVEGAGAGGGSR
jgi:membrane-associated phospholipid phosphatase